MYSKKDEDFIKRRNRENLIEFYREELLLVLEGRNSRDFMPLGVRRRLSKYGVLKKFGSRYLVTQLGMKILSKEASNMIVKSSGGGEG
ncbi:MAG: hypothetical protein NWE89_02275 [Candidatus Bathyarchaeota archaeon]|nr:hypothetical protein [Candidatus Bathyarchaeota archaeon]